MAKTIEPVRVSAVPSESSGRTVDKSPPKFGTGRVMEAVEGLPRVISPLDRLPKDAGGAKRFRVSCHNYHPKPVRYVLAMNESDAVDCYKSAVKFPDELARLKSGDGKMDEPDIVCLEQPD